MNHSEQRKITDFKKMYIKKMKTCQTCLQNAPLTCQQNNRCALAKLKCKHSSCRKIFAFFIAELTSELQSTSSCCFIISSAGIMLSWLCVCRGFKISASETCATSKYNGGSFVLLKGLKS